MRKRVDITVLHLQDKYAPSSRERGREQVVRHSAQKGPVLLTS